MIKILTKLKSVIDCDRFCQDCSHKKWLTKFGSRFCLHCRKNTNNEIRISISETINVRDSFGLIKKSAGFRSFAVKVRGGWASSVRYKQGVNLSRSFDKEKNEYHEVVQDYETGKVVHEVHEKLSEHTGHGSAKKQNYEN